MSENDTHRARIFLHRGDVPQARAAYEQAVHDDRHGTNPQALADSLGNLGNVCAMMDDYEMANRCYREVLTIQREQRNLQAVGQTLVNLGNVQVEAGRPEQARPYYL